MIKKALLTLALIGATAVSYGQGTVAFANNSLTRVTLVTPGVSTNSLPLAATYNFGLFWGTAPGSLALATGPLGVSSTSSAGIIAGGATLTYAVPGAAELTTYYMQIKGWEASFGSDWLAASTQGSFFGQTDIRQVTTAGALGPGTAIWQTATGTNPNRFTPLQLNAVVPIPEPSSFALAGLGAAALLIFRRRK